MRVIAKAIELFSLAVALLALGMLVGLLASPEARETDAVKMLVHYGCNFRDVRALIAAGFFAAFVVGGIVNNIQNNIGYSVPRWEKISRSLKTKDSSTTASIFFAISHLLATLSIYAYFSYQWKHCAA